MHRLASRIPRLVLLVVALLTALVPTVGLADDGPRPTSYAIPGTAVFPEGIAYEPSTGYFFVSSTTDGTIYRGHVSSPELSVFLPGGADGRTIAAGLEVWGGRLFVSGASTGMVWVYDLATKALVYSVDNGRLATFVNDVAVTKDGSAFFTESAAGSPVLYRLRPNGSTYEFSEWLTFAPGIYQPGFNMNGISATTDGKYLLLVQSNTGNLFRVTIATKEVAQIDLGGTALTAGDGIELRGHTLYVVRNALETIAEVRLSGDYSSGTVVAQHDYSGPLAFPTTAVQARGRLLVVNSQFDRRGPGLSPDLPFTVSSLPLP